MALLFEYSRDLETGAQPFICHEKDSKLYNYYMSDDRAMDASATAPLGQYDSVVFENESRSLTTKAVSRIGIKGFPGIGAIGFYKDAYSDNSLVVAPIHTDRDKTNAPVLKTVEVVDGKLHIVIEPPAGMSYQCYRVVVRQDPFAFEYITYKTDYTVDLPTVRGEYYAYCIGYDESTGAVSEDSNELPLTIETGTNGWAPYFETVDDLERRVDILSDNVTTIEQGINETLENHEERIILLEDSTELDIADLEERVQTLEDSMGDIADALDAINGLEV